MPYKNFWYEENEIVFTELIGDFSVDEMIAVNKEYAETYFSNSNRIVHLIVDLQGMSNYPKNLGLIRDVSKQTAQQEGLGWIILIGADNPFVKFLGSTVFQLLHVNCKIVGTLEEAENILKRIEFAESDS